MIQPPALEWVEQRLCELADHAWGPRRIAPESRFLIAAPPISSPATTAELEAVLQHYYAHARRWAPGFEAPWYIPKVTITPLLDGVGRYRVDQGYVFVEITPAIASSGPAALAVLAHEACHHILDLSSLHTHRDQVDEPTTDLAMFICGFGDVFMRGQDALGAISPAWRQAHLGYLTSQLYEFSYDWVLRVQRLRNARGERISTDTRVESHKYGGAKSRSWWERLCPWLFGTGEKITPSSPVKPTARSTYRPRTATGTLRKQLLNRLGGDGRVLERLLDHERRRQPGATELALLDAVAEQLNYDRRAPR